MQVLRFTFTLKDVVHLEGVACASPGRVGEACHPVRPWLRHSSEIQQPPQPAMTGSAHQPLLATFMTVNIWSLLSYGSEGF